jgi:outer membrane protein OmpA-like peptidoglycan-associated protein
MRGAVLGIALVVLLAGCAKVPKVVPAARNDLYILLQGADGKTGALVVTHGDQQQTLSTPNAAATIGVPGSLATSTLTEAEARRTFESALSAQPPRPTSFMLFFVLNSSDELTAESKAIVDDVLRDIARRPAPEVVVIGHTDTMGTDDYNDNLSLGRAKLISERLVKLGVPADRIQVAGRGKRELRVPTADQVAEEGNRRVEIVVR